MSWTSCWPSELHLHMGIRFPPLPSILLYIAILECGPTIPNGNRHVPCIVTRSSCKGGTPSPSSPPLPRPCTLSIPLSPTSPLPIPLPPPFVGVRKGGLLCGALPRGLFRIASALGAPRPAWQGALAPYNLPLMLRMSAPPSPLSVLARSTLEF